MNLREWMDENRISVADFATQIGVAANTVARWRNGARRPRTAELRRILVATAGAVTADDFYLHTTPASGPAYERTEAAA